MNSLARTLFAIAAACAAAPLTAAAEPPAKPLPDLAALSPQELFALFSEDDQRWIREPCTFGAPVAVALDQRMREQVDVHRLRLMAEALCADEEKRYADGARLVGQINTLTPDDPLPGLSLYFARQLKDPDVVLAILRGLGKPGLAALDVDNYFAARRLLTDAGRDKDQDALALEWATTGKLGDLDAQLRPAVAGSALRQAAREGRSDVVSMLLAEITSPVTYIDLLTFREYEAFWPQIERRAGPNLATVGAKHVTRTRARLAADPTDRDRFSEAAHALHYNGQFKDAAALAKRWRQREAAGVEIQEGDAWALNIEAYAYDSLGQPAKADAVFDDLAKLDSDKHNWVVNFVINRASRMVGQGRWEQGLKATDLARTVAEKQGTTYAKLIIAADRACAFARLGRAAEAAPELAYLRENAKEANGLTARGLMCHGLRDEAAALLMAGLADETLRDRTLGAFQTDELDLFYTATILPQAPDLLKDHPALAAELAKYLRPMPGAFIPQAALNRAARTEGAPAAQ